LLCYHFEVFQRQTANLKLVSVRECTALGPRAIQPHAVATEILNPEAISLLVDASVTAGHCRALYSDRGRASPNNDRLVTKTKNLKSASVKVLQLSSHERHFTVSDAEVEEADLSSSTISPASALVWMQPWRSTSVC
jgi:hypothetical protein